MSALSILAVATGAPDDEAAIAVAADQAPAQNPLPEVPCSYTRRTTPDMQCGE